MEQQLEDQKKDNKKNPLQSILPNRSFLKFWIIGIVVVFL
jgi:hypothetical protein